MARIEDVACVNITIIDGNIVALNGGVPVNIAQLLYNPGNPANWIGVPPTTGDEALDRLASRALTLENLVAAIPPQHGTVSVADAAERIALTPVVNDIAVQSDDSSSWIWSGTTWVRIDGNPSQAFVVADAAALAAANTTPGNIAVQTDTGQSFIRIGGAWVLLSDAGAAVTEVADTAARLALAAKRGDITRQMDDESSWAHNGVGWIRLDGQKPSVTNVADAAARLSLAPINGDVAIQSDDSSAWIYDGVVWNPLGGSTPVFVYDSVQDMRDAGTPTNLNAIFICRSVLGVGVDQVPTHSTFQWNATLSNADNTGIYVLPTGHTGTGRFQRLDNYGTIKAEWFGILGGQANATADTAALIAAWQYVVGRSEARGNLTFQLPNGQVYYNDPVGLFNSHTIGFGRGINIIGTASREGDNGTRLTLTGPALSFYNNTAGKNIGLTFERIIFDGDDRDGLKATKLFDIFSAGDEQFFTWRDCKFLDGWRGLDLSGGLNNAEHRWDSCQWRGCGGATNFDGACVYVDNNQAVSNIMSNCDWIINFGHILDIGPTGGGGNWHIKGGSCIGTTEATQAPHYIIHAMGVSGLSTANNQIEVDMKIEPRNNLRLVKSDSRIDVNMRINHHGPAFAGPTTRTTVEISGGARVTLRGGINGGGIVNQYTVGGTAANVLSPGSSLTFEDAHIPDRLFENVTVLDGGKWGIGGNCTSQIQQQPSAKATALGVPIIHRTAVAYASPNAGGTAISTPRRHVLSLEGVADGNSPGGVGAPIRVLLPPGVLIHRVHFEKSAQGALTVPFQLAATIGIAPATETRFAQTPVVFQRDAVTLDFESAQGVLVGTAEDERLLTIDTTSGNEGAAELHGFTTAYVEYSCP